MALEGPNGLGAKILSDAEIEEIEDNIERFDNYIDAFTESIDGIINSFSNEEIVQSFYASGNFGDDLKNRLIALKNGVTKYRTTMRELRTTTYNYCTKQHNLNTTGN